MKIDPVCRMEVLEDQAVSAEYEGRTYYFCSEGCRDKFLHSHARAEPRSAYDPIIIGGGNSAMQIVENLLPTARQVHIVSDLPLTADPSVIERADTSHRVHLHEGYKVRRIVGNDAVSGRLKDSGLAHFRSGKLLARNWRASSAYEVKIAPIAKPTGKAKITVNWRKNPRWTDWNELSAGCYLLRTNLAQNDPAILCKLYIQLTEAEWAFRITKDKLEIRPIWHQKPDRVKAHILVCFLAYVLWKSLGAWMEGSGLGSAPRTLVEELARIKSGDVVLPTVQADGRAGKTLRIRCVVRPDEYQQAFLSRLGTMLFSNAPQSPPHQRMPTSFCASFRIPHFR